MEGLQKVAKQGQVTLTANFGDGVYLRVIEKFRKLLDTPRNGAVDKSDYRSIGGP